MNEAAQTSMTNMPSQERQDERPEEQQPAPRAFWRIFAPAVAVALLIAAYAIYWHAVAGQVRALLEDFAVRSQDQSVKVGWSALDISGFPYRIEASLAAPKAVAPRTPENWSWTAEALDADFMPYNLRHVVLKVRGEQVLRYHEISSPRPRSHILRVTAAGTWASYVALDGKPFGRLAIDIGNLVAQSETVKGDETAKEGGKPARPGERFAAGRLQLHARPAGEPGAAPDAKHGADYDIALQGNDMAIGSDTAPRALGSEIALFSAQARLRNVPESTSASLVELSRDWLANNGSLAISDLQVKWGPLDMWAQGELRLDRQGRPEGSFATEIAGYAGLLDALVKARVVSGHDARLAAAGLDLVSQLQGAGSEGRVRVPLVMKNGRLYLGPLALTRIEPLY
jgi:hypothetical protein